jgi:hypothetical protein
MLSTMASNTVAHLLTYHQKVAARAQLRNGNLS